MSTHGTDHVQSCSVTRFRELRPRMNSVAGDRDFHALHQCGLEPSGVPVRTRRLRAETSRGVTRPTTGLRLGGTQNNGRFDPELRGICQEPYEYCREHTRIIEGVMSAMLGHAVIRCQGPQFAVSRRRGNPARQCKRAHTPRDRQFSTTPPEFCREEGHVERSVVGDQSAVPNHVRDPRKNRGEVRGPRESLPGQAVDVDRPRIAPGIDECVELGFDTTLRVEEHDGDRQDPVAFRRQAGRLDVDKGEGSGIEMTIKERGFWHPR